MTSALTLLALTGCGRFGFEAMPPDDGGGGDSVIDARIANGHDEDSDGYGDGEDNCPHLPNAGQLNTDADGVGDACDPEPAIARQTLAVFFAMTEPRPELTNVRWAQGTDVWTSEYGISSFFNLPFVATTSDVWFAINVLERAPAASEYQLTLNTSSQSVNPRYYVEVYDNTTAAYTSITQFDGTFSSVKIAPLAGKFHTGLLTVHAQFNGTAHTVSADVGWPAEPYRLDAVVPAFVGGDELRLRIDGLRSELLYFAVVTSGP